MSHQKALKGFMAGFTLIEMLVMLTVVLVLTLLAIPSYNTLINYYRISREAELLYTTLQYARTEAVKRNTSVFVSIGTGDNWCYGINTGSACNCSSGTCNLGITRAPATQQLSLAGTGLSSSAFSFNSSHAGASNSVTLTFSLYSNSSTLITTSISVMGTVTQCSTGVTGYTSC